MRRRSPTPTDTDISYRGRTPTPVADDTPVTPVEATEGPAAVDLPAAAQPSAASGSGTQHYVTAPEADIEMAIEEGDLPTLFNNEEDTGVTSNVPQELIEIEGEGEGAGEGEKLDALAGAEA